MAELSLTAPPAAQTVLARRCRVLLLAYPAAYRAERGEEILSTLLDGATAGQRAPRFADAADIVASGARLRLGTPTMTGFDGGLSVAAPIALALAAGISAFAWWRVEPVGAGTGGQAAFLGLFRTAGPVAYLAWLAAAAGRVLLGPRLARIALGAALAATLALPALTAVTPYDRPPLWVIMALAVFGILALAGTPAGARPSTDERLAILGGTIGLAVVASALVAAWPPGPAGFGYYYQPTIARVGIIVAGTVGAVAAYAVIQLLRTRSDGARPDGARPDGVRSDGVRSDGARAVDSSRAWLWATALLGLPAGWLGPFDSTGLREAADTAAPHFGRLAQVLLATGVAAVVIAGLAQRGTAGAAQAPVPRKRSLPVAGFATLGTAAGLAGFLVLGAGGGAGFAEPARHVPGHVGLTLAALVAAGLCGAVAGRPTRTGTVAFAIGAAVAFPAGWLVAAYDNGWTLRGWPDFGHTAALVATLAFLPFALCVGSALRVIRARTAPVPAAVAILFVSLGWVAYAAVPSVLSWGPVLIVLGSGLAVLGVSAHRRSPATR